MIKPSSTTTTTSTINSGISINTIPKSSYSTNNLRQYLLNSTLHGLRYVGDITITIFERFFFALAFVIVLVLSAYFISNVYQKWSASPVIIALSAVSTSISDIPFPAVTICNMNQAKESKVKHIMPNTMEDALLQSLCLKNVNFSETKKESPRFKPNWPTFRTFLLNVSQPCSEMLVYCRYATVVNKCMQLFNAVLTDEGLCCVFNLVHPMYLLKHYNVEIDEFNSNPNDSNCYPLDWTPENGYSSETSKNTYPRPAAGAGSHMGLSVILYANVDDYHCSTTNSVGFKVLLHPPTETPKIADFGFTITPGFEFRVDVTPRIANASPQIRKVPYIQRQCFFANEGNLSYYRTYSRKNCEMECESRLLESVCGCVLYYMPRVNEETTICNRDDWTCYDTIKLAIELNTNDTYKCSCLPSCFELSYTSSMSNSRLGVGDFTLRQEFIGQMKPEFVLKNLAVLHIFYEDKFFRSYTKEELIGFTEFLSNTGGLLGLFMGFSVVSLVEIFYFLTLRPYCTSRKNRHRRQELSDTTDTDNSPSPSRNNNSVNQFRRRGFKNNYISHGIGGESFKTKRNFNYNRNMVSYNNNNYNTSQLKRNGSMTVKKHNENLNFYLNHSDGGYNGPKYIYCE